MGDARRDFMEKQFARFSPEQPVHIVTPLQMKPEEFDGTIVEKHDSGPAYVDRVFGKKYSKTELSEIITAKTFFANASAHKMPYAVLLEDDIILTDGWAERIRMEVANAPPDWDVLQFFTNNLPVRFQLSHVCEPFVRWLPEYWGAGINVVSARGMAKLASRKITVQESPVVIDYWLYAGVTTYTHTRNWFGEHMFKSRMQHGTFSPSPGFPAPVACKTPVRKMPAIGAFTVTKQDELSVATILDGAPKGLEAWVFTVDQTKPPALTASNLYTAVCKTGAAPWVSKWSCLAQHRGILLHGRFEFIFAFDDDLEFNGFPWQTAWSRIAHMDAMIIGFPRESDWGNKEGDFSHRYEGELMTRDFFLTQNGDFWRNRTCGSGEHRDTGAFGEQCDARWEGQHAPRAQHDVMPMKYIETGSNLIRSDFLNWYLQQTSDFVKYMDHSGVDWGFDHMWCGAAASYVKTQAPYATKPAHSKLPCGMVPLPVWHRDTASLTGHYSTGGKGGGQSYKETGQQQLAWIQKHSAKYADWLEHSEWQRTMLGKANIWEFRADVSVEQIVRIGSRAEMDAFRKAPPTLQKSVGIEATPVKVESEEAPPPHTTSTPAEAHQKHRKDRHRHRERK